MKRMNSKAVVLLVTIAVLLTVTVGGTVAYLAASTPAVTNVFTPGTIDPDIDEDITNGVKKDVTVKNNGTVDAYIRAKIVVTWQNEAGQVYPVMPKVNENYTISYGTEWTKDDSDGFYYFNDRVAAGDFTGVLIEECKPFGTCPDTTYTLHVEVMAQAIQADGWNPPVDSAKAAFDAAAAGN